MTKDRIEVITSVERRRRWSRDVFRHANFWTPIDILSFARGEGASLSFTSVTGPLGEAQLYRSSGIASRRSDTHRTARGRKFQYLHL